MTEPIAFVTTRYRYPHCRTKTYRAKARAVAHVSTCFSNPARRSCKTCAHAEGPAGTNHTDRCAVGGFEGAAYFCSYCGECAEPDGCVWHINAKPLAFLRVECPLWAARPDHREEPNA